MKAATDYMLQTAWEPYHAASPKTTGGLWYGTVQFNGTNGDGMNRNLPTDFTTLNPFAMKLTAWLARELGDSGYLAWTEAFKPALRSIVSPGNQQPDEVMWILEHARVAAPHRAVRYEHGPGARRHRLMMPAPHAPRSAPAFPPHASRPRR